MSKPPAELERRLVERLMNCWRAAHPGFAPPSLDALYANGLGAMLGDLVFAAVSDRSAAPVMRLIGAAYREHLLPDPTGRPVTDARGDTLLGRAVEHWQEVLCRGVPVIFSGTFDDGNRQSWLYRSIIMPVSEDGRRVTHLLCAANGRQVAPAAIAGENARVEETERTDGGAPRSL